MPQVKPRPLSPYWQTTDGKTVRLYLGNVTDVLARMPEKSVQCVVTSPPYWGLRDYGTATWTGGSVDCVHDWGRKNEGHVGKAAHDPTVHKSPFRGTAAGSPYLDQGKMSSMTCLNGCGAVRTDQQLGSEPSPDCKTDGQAQCGKCFVCSMVVVFRGVYRVLRDDGTCWINLGDTYGGYSESRNPDTATEGVKGYDGVFARRVGQSSNDGTTTSPGVKSGLKPGNLVGVPWRVALALQGDGWVLRQDVIWHKPSPMPESVRNRCTKAHEYVFLLTKGAKYFYDAEAIKEPTVRPGEIRKAGHKAVGVSPVNKMSVEDVTSVNWSNRRSVWTISAQGYPGAHFATFPPKLIEPMIRAGTSERGCCAECGAPWRRVMEERQLKRDRPNDYVKRTGEEGTGNSCSNSVAGVETRTVGWEPTCKCGDVGTIPCTVLDPFIGSGTSCDVSIELGRHSVGIDLSEKYLRDNAIPRITGALLRRRTTAGLVGDRDVKAVDGGTSLMTG